MSRGFIAGRAAGLGAVVLLVATALWPQEGLEIVRRSIDYHGGDLYEKTEVALRLCSGSGCYDVRAWRDGGLYEHQVAGPVSAGHREVIATNDSLRHWADGVEQAVESPADEQSLRDWATARLYFAFLPFRLNDPGVRQHDLGLESWGGRDLHKVKITFRAGSSSDAQDEFLYWFDPETSRLEQFAYSYDGSPGGLRFRTLEDYRRVGGILFSDQSNLGIEGDGLSVDQITPDYVASALRLISRVRLEEIEVRASAGGS